MPRSISLFARVRGVFHCRHRIERSFLRNHSSSCSNVFFTAASLKYSIQPVRSGAAHQSPVLLTVPGLYAAVPGCGL